MTTCRATTSIGLALSLGLVACGGGDDATQQTASSNFYGTYSDQTGAEGTIMLAGQQQVVSADLLAPGTESTLSGTLQIVGQGAVTLTGTYDSTDGTIVFSGPPSYSFQGTVDTKTAVGTGNGPNGSSVFVLFHGGTDGSVDTYCGTAVCTAPAGCDLLVDLTLSVETGTALLTVSVNQTVFIGAGTATASTVDFHITQGGIDVTIHGAIDGNTVAGTWSDAINGASGTFSAGTCF
ncbi:MAG TPA: hypothetical protein VJ826_05130 [Candidatus Polarisedimenticolaceae bacterium]|nr:hypothetical protein [Candidatus Polarisedimenticolaceae bacterium]